ncbi:MAG: right-handed parallel beta-helix repeat-containing protein [Pseudomonadota bacterium]
MRGSSYVALAVSAFGVIGFAGFAESEPLKAGLGLNQKWQPQAEIGVGLESVGRTVGELDLLSPVAQNQDTLLFVNVRGDLTSEESEGASFGLGARRMVTEGRMTGYNLGAYAFYDVRSTEINNDFDQVGIGLEALGPNFDFRVNGYLPIDDEERAPDETGLVIEDGLMQIIQGAEVAMKGLDGEIGYRVPIHSLEADRQLRVFFGGFAFESDNDRVEDIEGLKARAEYRVYNVGNTGGRLTAYVAGRTDDVRDEVGIVGLQARFPIGGRLEDTTRKLNWQERRMVDRIERDGQILTQVGKFGDSEWPQNPLTGAMVKQTVTVTGNDDLATAAADAGEHSLLVIDGSDAAIEGTLALVDNQTVIGAGSTIGLVGLVTGTPVTYTAPAGDGTITTSSNAPAFVVASNNHIHSVTVTGAGANSGLGENRGVIGDSVDTVVLTQNTFTGIGDDAVRLAGTNTNVTITGNTFTDIGEDGVDFPHTNNTDITISDNVMTNLGLHGVVFRDENSNVTVSGNSIDTTNSDGIEFGRLNTDLTIVNNQINNVAWDSGINLMSRNTNVLIEGNAISNVNQDGIEFNSLNENISVIRNHIDNAGIHGVEFLNGNIGVVILDNAVTNVGAMAFRMVETNVAEFSLNTVSGSIGGSVFRFVGGANTLAGTGNIASGATVGGSVCDSTGAQTGSFEVDGASCP